MNKPKMNKPIIVDGVDVSECIELREVINEEPYCDNSNTIKVICKGNNCYYKQLQRQEQENLRLEAENKKLIEENYELSVNQEDIEQYKTIIHNKNIDIEQLQSENHLLKLSLKNKDFVGIAEANERLKAENERLSELTCVNCGEKFLSPTGSELYEENVQLKAENDLFKNAHKTEQDRRRKYEQALEDIEEIANRIYYICDEDCGNGSRIRLIIDKINEVLKDG